MQEQTENVMVQPVYIPPLAIEENRANAHWLKDEQKTWKEIIQDVVNKRIERCPYYAHMTVTIDKADVHFDENITIVVVDCNSEQVVGWAKFNPKDVRFLSGINKRQRFWMRKESKHREMAGAMKAIDRVVEKILNP